MTLPVFYSTVSAASIYSFWDGFNVANPNEVNGRLLLIGVYDIENFPHFDPVQYCTTKNFDLEYIGGYTTARARVNGQLVVDKVNPVVGDRVLFAKQTDPTQNGIYQVVKTGSEEEPFELTKIIDKTCSGDECITTNNSGKTVFVEGGSTLANHTFQLMRYVCKGIGLTPQNFIDLTAEGFWTNARYGLRLVDSVASSSISSLGSDRYTMNIPNFLSHTSARLLKVLVPYNVDLKTVMQSLLDKDIKFNLVNGAVPSSSSNVNKCCF